MNSLKGVYTGDSIGDYYRGYGGDARSLDYFSCVYRHRRWNETPKP